MSHKCQKVLSKVIKCPFHTCGFVIISLLPLYGHICEMQGEIRKCGRIIYAAWESTEPCSAHESGFKRLTEMLFNINVSNLFFSLLSPIERIEVWRVGPDFPINNLKIIAGLYSKNQHLFMYRNPYIEVKSISAAMKQIFICIDNSYVQEVQEDLPIEMNSQRCKGSDKDIKPHVKLSATYEERLLDIFRDDIGLRLVLWCLSFPPQIDLQEVSWILAVVWLIQCKML